ncbi:MULTISPECIES: hypothetical protein [Hyphobacterium]|uniref:Yip1 domain-containing protein n=1 Tax=Hyphobacterium vulgare TaxID=1736751 RepID=A0ABV6ZUH9_9PROT
MADSNKPDDTRPTRADADDVAEAMIGFDTRIVRTVWDTIIHTPRVLQAAYAGDRDLYIPIIRIFLILFGMQFAVMAFVGVPVSLTTESFATTPEAAARLDAWLAAEGLDRAAVDQTLERAASLSITALILLSSLPYILLMKAYRPSRSFYGHVLAYLLTTNVSYIIMLPILALAVFGNFLFWYLVSTTIGLLTYFAATARIFASHYATTVAGVIFKTLGVVLLLPLSFIIVGTGQFLVAEFALQTFHDTTFLDLMTTSLENPSQ